MTVINVPGIRLQVKLDKARVKAFLMSSIIRSIDTLADKIKLPGKVYADGRDYCSRYSLTGKP